MSNAIELKGLRKSYGSREILRGLELNIPQGTTYGLVGPNGAGKTTLFRILVGLTDITSGSAAVLGKKNTDTSIKQSIGYMTQAEALYSDLTIEENLKFFGRLFGLYGNELETAASAALELVHLKERAGSRVDELSGGMKRRVSLACAIIHRPRLLLLDEPTAGVDPELRAEFWTEFVKWGKQGTTLIISTHHLDEAGRCDRLGLLREGQFIAQGKPADLLQDTGASTIEEAFLAFARRKR